MSKFRIDVPKAGAASEDGLTVRLYELGEEVNATKKWQKELMNRFVQNGWATELKVTAPSEKKTARKKSPAKKKTT